MNYVVPGAYPGGSGGGGGGAGPIQSITAGTGISVTGTSTVPIISNTGVASLTGTGAATVTSLNGDYTINVNNSITTVNGESGAITLTATLPVTVTTVSGVNTVNLDFVPATATWGSPSYTLLAPTTLQVTVQSVNQYSGTNIVSYNIGLLNAGWYPTATCYIVWTGGTTGSSYVRESLPVNSGDATCYHSGTFIFDAPTSTTLEVEFIVYGININTPGVYPGIVGNSFLTIVKLNDA